MAKGLTPTAVAKLIEHTLLNADATEAKIKNLCQEAKKFGFGCVVVHPVWVRFVSQELKDFNIRVGTVCGFPFGANKTSIKVAEAKTAREDGATDIDMVLNIGWLKAGLYKAVQDEIYHVVKVVKQVQSGVTPLVKVIIETCLLTQAEKVKAAQLIKAAGADFVKTSTGYLGPGANVADVALLRQTVGPKFGIKASGGIRTAAAVKELLKAGANKIGTSAGVKIMQEWLSELN